MFLPINNDLTYSLISCRSIYSLIAQVHTSCSVVYLFDIRLNCSQAHALESTSNRIYSITNQYRSESSQECSLDVSNAGSSHRICFLFLLNIHQDNLWHDDFQDRYPKTEPRHNCFPTVVEVSLRSTYLQKMINKQHTDIRIDRGDVRRHHYVEIKALAWVLGSCTKASTHSSSSFQSWAEILESLNIGASCS